MSEIKPCPFCGAEAKALDYKNPFEDAVSGVGCISCGAEMAWHPDAFPYDTAAEDAARQAETVAAWNTRAPQQALIAELVEALEAMKTAAAKLHYEADHFSVSGVYFNEACFNHKGLDLVEDATDIAEAALAKAKSGEPT